MSTTNPSKTQGTSLLAWQDIATANTVISSVSSVGSKLSAAVYITLARRSGTAFTTGWPNIRIEASAKSSGNDSWFPLSIFQPAVGASIANTTLNGAVSAAASTVTVTSATNIAAGDMLFLGDTSTANYEAVRVKSISGTTVTPEEVVTYGHANSAIVTDQVEKYFAQYDLTSISRIRAVCDNANSGQSISVEVLMTTGDSLVTV